MVVTEETQDPVREVACLGCELLTDRLCRSAHLSLHMGSMLTSSLSIISSGKHFEASDPTRLLWSALTYASQYGHHSYCHHVFNRLAKGTGSGGKLRLNLSSLNTEHNLVELHTNLANHL